MGPEHLATPLNLIDRLWGHGIAVSFLDLNGDPAN